MDGSSGALALRSQTSDARDPEELSKHLFDVLVELEGGDLSVRVDSSKGDPRDPLVALAAATNAAIEEFSRMRQEAMSFRAAIDEQIQTIQTQQEAIRALSVPVIEVLDGVICAPMVGLVDWTRANDLSSALADAVVAKMCRLVVIDITAIETMDTATTDHFLRIASCVRTLGADCVLSGVRPHVAQAIIAMGVDTSAIRSFLNLRDALQWYVGR